jgi:hypothetical protein
LVFSVLHTHAEEGGRRRRRRRKGREHAAQQKEKKKKKGACVKEEGRRRSARRQQGSTGGGEGRENKKGRERTCEQGRLEEEKEKEKAEADGAKAAVRSSVRGASLLSVCSRSMHSLVHCCNSAATAPRSCPLLRCTVSWPPSLHSKCRLLCH